MNHPSHDEIAVKAYGIWEQRGHPDGTHDEIWIEAERQLNQEAQKPAPAPAPAASVAQHAIAPTTEEKKVIVAAVQKEQARAPQVPHHTGPTTKPAVTGKPVWPKGHSA